MADPQSQEEVLTFLQSLSGESAPGGAATRIDTHANIVFLVGERAYKVKRAVRFPFLDYSTLALREAACKAEIEVNSANAPQIYRQALAITREADGSLALAGPGTPVEWAVEMTRFDRADELEVRAEQGPLGDDLATDLADMMLAAHEAAPLRDGAGFHAELESYVEQNDAAFREHPDLFPAEDTRHLGERSRMVLDDLRELILRRGDQGLVRRCHGDAHLRNIVLIEGAPVLFDAVEFSDAIATGDVLYDLAFLLMDLWERGQTRAANLVFNRYLDLGRLDSHPEGLAALPFYLMMRAAIRAKIAASSALAQNNAGERSRQQDQARGYFRHALAFLEPSRPRLVAVGGLSGTGKSTLARRLAPELGRAPGARVLRTDVVRKRLLGISQNEKAPATAYTKDASARVYEALEETARDVLAAGHSAIFDAVLAEPSERGRLAQVAASVEADFAGLWLTALAETLKERVAARKGDASDATPDVVDIQLGYDTGRIDWQEIDAGGSPEATLSKAREALGLGRGPEREA